MNVTYSLALTLDALTAGYSYGFELMDVTGLPSGTIYPLLRRLERQQFVVGKCERESTARSEGRPAPTTGGGRLHISINWPNSNDKQFALSIAHWLSRLK